MKQFRVLFLGLFASLLPIVQESHAQGLLNGGFEGATLAPWTSAGDANATVGNGGIEGVRHARIAFAAAFFGASSLSFSQTFNIVGSGLMNIHFAAQRFDEISGQNDVAITFQARIDSQVLTSSVPGFTGSGLSPTGWTIYDVTTSSLAPGAHTLTFDFTRGASGFGRSPTLALDAVSVAAVPEPGTWAMGLAGGVLVLARRRIHWKS